MNISNESLKQYLIWIGIGLLGAAVLTVVFLFIVLSAKPGSGMYSLKVDVVEEAIEYAYFTPEAKANYHLKLLKRRLAETNELNELNTVDETVAEKLFSETEERANELTALLAAADEEALSRVESLMLVHEMSVHLRNQEVLIESTEKFASTENIIESTRRDAQNLFGDLAVQLMAHGTDEQVQELMTMLLNELLGYIENDELSDDARDRVDRFIFDVQDNIANNEIVDAIETLGDGLRFVASEIYMTPYAQEVEVPSETESTESDSETTEEIEGTVELNSEAETSG